MKMRFSGGWGVGERFHPKWSKFSTIVDLVNIMRFFKIAKISFLLFRPSKNVKINDFLISTKNAKLFIVHWIPNKD